MRYAQIREMDISNGEGIGAALFVQGCHFHCKGCFNQETWDFSGGKEFTDNTKEMLFSILKKEYIKRLSILGGEPLCDENIETVKDIIKEVKLNFPNICLWLYTGYTLDEINKSKKLKDAISLVDVFVEGRYIQELTDSSYQFAGSTNQHVIRNNINLNSKSGDLS